MTVRELEAVAERLRAYGILAIHCAGSGHPGGTLSIMDIVAALYFEVMNHEPNNPEWQQRDRCIWSTGHKAPALYVALAESGYCKIEDVITGLRKLDSCFEGHPNGSKLPGVEVSTGSLGQGLGYAVGQALDAKERKLSYTTYCIMGDGEHDEGSVWEAIMAASNFKLDNLVAIVDKNGLQIDGATCDVMNIDPLDKKYEAFNWHVITIDGHNMQQILDAFAQARKIKGKPTCIIANTIKGKGVSFMENLAGWHGVPTKTIEQLYKAMNDIGAQNVSREFVDKMLMQSNKIEIDNNVRAKASIPKFSREYWWNTANSMKVEMDPTRMGFGRGLKEIGDDPRICTLTADISESIRISDFWADHPERKSRVYSLGIAEQNMVSVACGLARNGRIPIGGTYGVFACGRNWDQWRTMACYGNLNVKMAGAHGGISVGADGATHQSLEEIAILNVLPNMNLSVPADSMETCKAAKAMILDVIGPGYIRYAREATPVISHSATPYQWGIANIIRFRGEKACFVDAFETCLSTVYKNENEEIAIIACGPMVAESMRAAWILKNEFGVETRIINIHTVKPIDRKAIAAAVNNIGLVITAEEHQSGGFGSIVTAVAAQEKNVHKFFKTDMIGMDDRFGQSGQPWQLMQKFGLTAENIAERAIQLYKNSKRLA